MVEMDRKLSPVFAADEREELFALRQRDADTNLVRRWGLIRDRDPRLAERRLGFVPLIIDQGWAIVGVTPDEGFSYTVGLKYRFDHPELLLVAPQLDLSARASLLNALVRGVAAGKRLSPGASVLVAERRTTFRAYSAETFRAYPTGFLASFERNFEDRDHVSGDTLPVLWAELPKGAKATQTAASRRSRPTKAPKRTNKRRAR